MAKSISSDFGIGTLAELSGVKIANIRYYESIGLLPLAARRNGRHRTYDQHDVNRLQFIRNARETGFSVEKVRSLLHLAEPKNQTCDEAKRLSMNQLHDIRRRIRELKTIEKSLLTRIAACDQACQCGRADDCAVLQFQDAEQ